MKITILDAYPLNPGDISWEPLHGLGELEIHASTPPELTAERVRGSEIVLTNKAPLNAAHLPALAACKMIGVLATGVNILDLNAMNRAGISVSNVPAYGVTDVAEHALALLLELARGTALHSTGVKQGEWQKNGWCYWHKAPLALAGRVMGIIGFGAIGRQLGKYAHALGMKVLACSPSQKAVADYPFAYCQLNEILKNADVISLHCPLTPQTRHIINTESLKLLKPGALIINTARGELIDEQAAAHALANGQLGGLGTDVLSQEPPDAANPLLNAPNTLITPHMAWATRKARQNIVDIMARNIKAFLQGKPINLVTQAAARP